MITALSLSPDRLRTRFIHVRRELVGQHFSQLLEIQINFIKPQVKLPKISLKLAHQIRQVFQGPITSEPIVIYDSHLGSEQFLQPQSVIHPGKPKRNWGSAPWLVQLKNTIHAFRTKNGDRVEVKPKVVETKLPSVLHKTAQAISLSVIGIALLVAAIIFVPQLYYTLFPATTIPIEAATEGTPLGGNFDLGAETALKDKATTQERYLPPQDDSLPDGNWIIIPRIGVRTELQKTYDVEGALETGVLWEPDYGQPGDLDLPMIVVAHRFGYKWWWKSDYWKYHSFYLLPELEPGDLVEVISDHRKWTYEIYAGEEGEEVTDYEADLILYTCKYLNSSIRHFRYARIINMNVDTQAS